MTSREDPDDDDNDGRVKRGATTAQRIPQHKHCMICNKAIPSKESWCSEECENKYKALESKRRNYMYIMYAIMIFVFVVIFFLR